LGPSAQALVSELGLGKPTRTVSANRIASSMRSSVGSRNTCQVIQSRKKMWSALIFFADAATLVGPFSKRIEARFLAMRLGVGHRPQITARRSNQSNQQKFDNSREG